MNTNPLVSVVVVTYNSADYIIDALESIKMQTYNNIELIVSDDCSDDKTIDIVSEWILLNKSRFSNFELLTVDTNSGITKNMNRAVKGCHGKWAKFFAGDDILLPSCIYDNVEFAERNGDTTIVLSNSVVFYNDSSKEVTQKPGLLVPGFFEMPAHVQYETLISKDVLLNSNSMFVSVDLLHTIGFDERIRNMEDRPFFWNCARLGYKLSYLDKETVRYRKHAGALTGLFGNKLISLPYNDSLATFYYLVRKPEMEQRGIDVSQYEKRILWYLFVKYIFKNNGNFFTRTIAKIVSEYFLI